MNQLNQSKDCNFNDVDKLMKTVQMTVNTQVHICQ